MNESPFIVVRYAAGGAGRFISTLLQLSDNVAHWNQVFEDRSKLCQTEYINYLLESFPEDPSTHLRVEPDLPYYSDFYSGTYNRGVDITYTQFCEYQHQANCEYFFNNCAQHKYVNLILHKSKIPVFMHGAPMVNVIIDTPDALVLAQKLLWLKHYQVINNTLVKKLTHDPATGNKKRERVIRQFNKESPFIMINNLQDFYTDEIIKNQDFELFQNTSLLIEDISNTLCPQHYFYLSNIFDKKKLIENINLICKQLDISYPNEQLISLTFDIWWKNQHKILNQWNIQ